MLEVLSLTYRELQEIMIKRAVFSDNLTSLLDSARRRNQLEPAIRSPLRCTAEFYSRSDAYCN